VILEEEKHERTPTNTISEAKIYFDEMKLNIRDNDEIKSF
jgi:hypothetical protein